MAKANACGHPPCLAAMEALDYKRTSSDVEERRLAGQRQDGFVPDQNDERLVAGVDEVGRGPLAGPVVAAAVVLLKPMAGLADSKTLSSSRRETLAADLLRPGQALVSLAAASAREIDALNILQATMLAMRRAIDRLPVTPDLALIDGNRLPELPCPAEAVVGGDRAVPAIAAASIIAKVTRDRLMTRLDHRHPGYGWSKNAGYPTAEHRAALARLGACRHHRRSFAPVKAIELQT